MWPTIALIALLSSSVAEASRAYPHGCLYRHPSYYTYDERDDISWTTVIPERQYDDELLDTTTTTTNNNNEEDEASFVDFRKLPPRSSRLRRPYERYRLTRRLGAGKFSDVFEAVDVQWEETIKKKKAAAAAARRKRKRVRETGGGETTEGEETEAATDYEYDDDCSAENPQVGGRGGGGVEEGASLNPESLVVLKCLKPVTERKIRRELLVLTHCVELPNLARVIGIVLPDSMDEENTDDDGDDKDQVLIEQHILQQQEVPALHPRKRRRHHHHLQRENIGSITDAASMEFVRQKKSTATPAATQSKKVPSGKTPNNTLHQKNKKQQQQHGTTQLPALVLQHAGQNAQWFCHGQQLSQNSNKDNNNNNNSNNYLSEYEMKYYLCHLLLALDGLHAAGIMHRDVKPRNTLINRQQQQQQHQTQSIQSHLTKLATTTSAATTTFPPPQPLMLVDLGLADFYLPGKEYNVRVASRHYKSPELLIGFTQYDYAIDMWSVGCMLAGLLFRREPFFRGKDNEDQLGRIVSVLGTRDFLPYCRKCGVRLSSKARAAIGRYCSRGSLASASSSLSSEEEEALSSLSSSSSASSSSPSLLNNGNMKGRTPWMSFLDASTPVPSSEALDLLDKLLVYDHEQRWTAREALGHAFFDDVRERVLREVQERIAWEEQEDGNGHGGRDGGGGQYYGDYSR